MIESELKGRKAEFELQDGPNVVGSSLLCNIRLKHASIDEVHMILRYFKEDQKIMVFDNDSDRGCFKMDSPNQKVALKPKQTFEYDLTEFDDGVVLYVGEAKLTVSAGAA